MPVGLIQIRPARESKLCLARELVPDGRINTTEKLANVISKSCSAIDFLWVSGCDSCTQEQWAKLSTLRSITSSDPDFGYSIFLGRCPLIESTDHLSGLHGQLMGAIVIEGNPNMTSLMGLGNLQAVGRNKYGRKIVLANNPSVVDASPLGRATPQIAASELRIAGNSRLNCTPAQWPDVDSLGNLIPKGTLSNT